MATRTLVGAHDVGPTPGHATSPRLALGRSALVVALGCTFFVGCGNPKQQIANCAGAPESAMLVLGERITADAELRNGKIVEVDGAPYSFISAEVHLATDERHHKGDIATWAIETDAADAAEADILAVDVVARESSSWPPATFNVTEHGAIESRACTDLSRGKTPEQLKCERDLRDQVLQLPAGKKCSDL